MANTNSANVSILLGGARGQLLAPTSLTVGDAPRSVAVGDFDADADLAVANAGSGNVSILLNEDTGPPVAVDDAYSTDEDTPLVVDAPGVLANDTDSDGDALSALLISGPANAASFSLNPDGSYSYTPDAGYSGSTRSPTWPTTPARTRIQRRSRSP